MTVIPFVADNLGTISRQSGYTDCVRQSIIVGKGSLLSFELEMATVNARTMVSRNETRMAMLCHSAGLDAC